MKATETSGVPPAPGAPTVPLSVKVNGVSLKSLAGVDVPCALT